MTARHALMLLVLGLCSSSALAAEKPPAAFGSSEYLIGPGDVLQVFVWKEQELTREVSVRLDGKITVPLLGDVEAVGRTPASLAEDVAQRLARYLATPLVTVGLSHANSTRFYVVGQVMKPGEYPMAGPMTVLQALAVAGGFRDFARSDSILIVRRGQGKQTVIPVNYKRLESGRDIDAQNVALHPGDTIVVP